MTEVVTVALALIVWVAQAQAPAPGVDPIAPWAEYGIIGLCLAGVALFARQSIDRERKRADEAVALLTEELRIERERNDREQARLIAQRDGLINDFFRQALPALSRVNEVLGNRQVIDEKQIETLHDVTDTLKDVRRLLEARAL